MDIKQLLWFVVAMIANTSVNLIIKQFATTNNYFYFVTTIVLYLIILMAYIQIFRNYPLYWLFPLSFIPLILVILYSVIFLHEKIKPINVIGILIGFGAIYMVVI